MDRRGKREGAACDNKRPIPVADLFGARREIELEYRGATYRLRITRNDKLILTK